MSKPIICDHCKCPLGVTPEGLFIHELLPFRKDRLFVCVWPRTTYATYLGSEQATPLTVQEQPTYPPVTKEQLDRKARTLFP